MGRSLPASWALFLLVTAVSPGPGLSQSPGEPDLIDRIAGNSSLQTVALAIRASGLEDALRGDGPFTVFAPTDQAFAKLPATTLQSLLDPLNRATLAAVLKHHVSTGRIAAPTNRNEYSSSVTTLDGATLPLQWNNGRLRVGPAAAITTDVPAPNGVFHTIDTVLLPAPTVATALIANSPAALIEKAVSRGVPLFNDGQIAACGAIYEMAILGLLQNQALDLQTRSDFGDALRNAAQQSPTEAAWTMRRALDYAYADLDVEAPQAPSAPEVLDTPTDDNLFDFATEDQVDAWRPLNDTVMGGRSRSRMEPGDGGTAVFSGTMSLENNGGFASVRAPVQPLRFENAVAIEMRVRGDGRSYRFLVSETRTPVRGSYDMDFDTIKGEWTTVRIALEDMRFNVMGRRPRTRPVIAEDIEAIGLLLGDKREGEFQLEIDWIKTVPSRD